MNKEEVYDVLRELFPKQNDFSDSDYSEELQELLDFGIYSQNGLYDLIKKHRRAILEIDRSEIDDYHIRLYTQEYGNEYVEDRLKNEYWFAYPGLLRLALELEFGDRYIEYANQRDKID